jgi:hypothetical protein
MKKINVILKNKTTLELTEDAKTGDIIDLTELNQVDLSFIEEAIDAHKDKVYDEKLEAYKKTLMAENQIKINSLEEEIKRLKTEQTSALKEADTKQTLAVELAKKEEKEKYAELNIKYQTLENEVASKVKAKELELENKYTKEISELKALIEQTKTQKDLEKEKALNDQNTIHLSEVNEYKDTINALQRQKASLNVKQTGEDLEAWCDNEVTSYMQNGLFNCIWEKDNKVVKNEDEAKGSKADFIFKIFVDEKQQDLLTSVCLEMKDENPDSKNKHTNESYYKKLDENRNKKNCKYALLVSNLEMDKPNILPIFKVREYPDMYVVRPAYLMVFLNMIASLTTRFSNLILAKENEMLELKDKNDLIEEFNNIKASYLDGQLEMLEKQIASIQKSTESIRKASNDIDASCEKMVTSYINKINDKLAKFELKLNKSVIKKLD